MCEMATGGPRTTRAGMRRCPGGARRAPITRVVHRDGDCVVVEISSEIDVHTVGEMRAVLLALADEDRITIVADFSRVRFCDAAGLGALVAVNNRVTEGGGSLRLTGVRPAQRRILRITGLDRLFRRYNSVAEALIR